jgi:hypothetical protein
MSPPVEDEAPKSIKGCLDVLGINKQTLSSFDELFSKCDSLDDEFAIIKKVSQERR